MEAQTTRVHREDPPFGRRGPRMLVRPDRLLPSVIVGALVAGALAFGAGTASAAGTCLLGIQRFDVGGAVTEDSDGTCLLNGVKPSLDGLVAFVAGSSTPSAAADPGDSGSSGGDVVSGVGDVVSGVGDAVTGAGGSTTGGSQDTESESATGSGGEPSAGAGTAAGTGTGGGGPAAGGPAAGGPALGAALVAPAALPTPDVRAAVAPTALTAPGTGFLAGLPTLSFGRPNPGLFAPLGSPLRTLTGVAPGSPVTTSSDVQAMAFDDLPGGLGTPAITGVVILSVLGGVALRHRVLRRARTER